MTHHIRDLSILITLYMDRADMDGVSLEAQENSCQILTVNVKGVVLPLCISSSVKFNFNDHTITTRLPVWRFTAGFIF